MKTYTITENGKTISFNNLDDLIAYEKAMRTTVIVKPAEPAKPVETSTPITKTVPASGSAVEIYTDGSCSGNPGPGGWGAILRCGEVEKELYGSEKETTNNRMELMAAIRGLEALKRPCEVIVYSDSAYLVNAFEKLWVNTWKTHCWKKKDGNPVENVDLWTRLVELTSIHKVTFSKVAGHAGVAFNERADSLARRGTAEAK